MDRIEQPEQDVIDLGAASVETKGSPGFPVEADDMGPVAELSE